MSEITRTFPDHWSRLDCITALLAEGLDRCEAWVWAPTGNQVTILNPVSMVLP